LLTLGFVAVTLVGTTVVALFRSWRWLPVLAFALAAPQLASWLLGEGNAAIALGALVGFWALNLVAAAGEEVRVRRDDLRGSSASLVLANALFLAWGCLVVLDGDLEPWRGVTFALFAALHVVIGGWFLARQGLEHRFGNTVAATGVGFLTLAAAIQLGAAFVPAAWAIEAVVLTWLAVRLDHRYSALAACALGALAILALAVVVYPFWELGRTIPGAPFAHAATVSLVVVAGAWLAAAALVPVRWIRSLLGSVGILVVAYAGPFEVTGPALVGWLSATAFAGVALDAIVARLPDDASRWPALRRPVVEASGHLAALGSWLGAVLAAVTGVLALGDWATVTPPSIPFSDERALAGAFLVAAPVASAIVTEWPAARAIALLGALAAAWYVVPFEVYADGVVVAWCGLAALALLAAPRVAAVPSPFRTAFVAGFALVALSAAAVALVIVAPPSRLVVGDGPGAVAPMLAGWPLAFGALAALLLWAGRDPALARYRGWLSIGAAATLTYLASVAVVAAFQARVGGGMATEELAKQAQVALSVLWTALGAIGLVVGLVGRRALVRDAGLGLLALATAKVFLVDLAALDVAYRVLSFAALGLLLLVSAWLFTRFRGPRSGSTGVAGGPAPGA
jgi:hypothetical protein